MASAFFISKYFITAAYMRKDAAMRTPHRNTEIQTECAFCKHLHETYLKLVHLHLFSIRNVHIDTCMATYGISRYLHTYIYPKIGACKCI